MPNDFPRYSRHLTRGPRWQALRMAVLERDDFRCVDCGARGRLEFDHIEPVRKRPDLAYDPANLQALCPSCHSAKTHVEVGRVPPAYDRHGWRQAVTELMAEQQPLPPREGGDEFMNPNISAAPAALSSNLENSEGEDDNATE